MKICHTITTIDKNHGGTSTYMQMLSRGLADYSNVIISAIKTKNPLIIDDRVSLILKNTSYPHIEGYSRDLKQFLSKVNCDIFHGNGIWQFPVHYMCLAAQKRKIPYVISLHGMLEPFALKHSIIRKKIALLLYQFNDIARANCIHATAMKEAINIRNLGFKNPIAIIPNCIDINEYSFIKKKKGKEKKTLLFFSRIHPIKGIELLIDAWERVELKYRNNWIVKIAGNGEEKYINYLHKYILKKKLDKSIFLIGPKFGQEKKETFQNADLFILPSYSENFGIVVAEALASAIPVITTKNAPWEDLYDYSCGWWVDSNIEQIAQAIQSGITLTDNERQNMGNIGRQLIIDKYSLENITNKMLELYNWLIKNGNKPDFILE